VEDTYPLLAGDLPAAEGVGASFAGLEAPGKEDIAKEAPDILN